MSWSTTPTFGDPCARVSESVHKASGARFVEVLYGSANEQGEPRTPERGDGHGHLIAIELGGMLEPLVERAPLGPADEVELNKRAGMLYDADRRDWDQAYRSDLLRNLERTLIQRRRLCSRLEGLTRGRISTLKQVFDEIHGEWDGLARHETPVEQELIARFDQANGRCLELIAAQQENKAAKEALIAEARELSASSEWSQANEAFDRLFARWRELKSAGREDDQRLWEAFNACRHDYYQRRNDYFKDLHARQTQSRQAKEGLLGEVHEAFPDVTAIQDWPEAGRRMDEFMERWKAAGSAGREQEERLWGEFKKVRDDFSAARRAYYADLRLRRQEVAAQKRQLIEEAAAITRLEDYSHEQVERMKQINETWKEAGSAGHEVDRTLWAEFRAAQDDFWDARRLEMRQLHAERAGRMQSAIDRRQDQVANLKGQIDALRERITTTRSAEKQEEINGWIAEKVEIIERLEEEIEGIRRRM